MHHMGHGHGHGMGHSHGMSHSHDAATTSTTQQPSGGESRSAHKGYALVAVVYLLGLCMGALDMSIVNPARTVIQNSLGVDDGLGVWILTIYTLAYACSIPIMGKLADRFGRKYIYLLCIFLFGAGSALCGLAHSSGSFSLLIGARVVQALGGGGIMPVATAEFGTAFPEEKRGMALGLVGMVYGLSSILGPSAGSAILELFGQTQWQYIFFVNVPICIIVLAIGIAKLPNSTADDVKPIDGLGILILTIMTLSVMYGLKNVDFFNFVSTFTSTKVWPFLLVFVILLPLFILRERRAKDPVLNLRYFTNRNIVITLLCAIVSGIIMMGTIFFPQFCENALFMKSGSGGYFIALLGLGSGVGAMMSGKLIDRHGVKPVLGAGFLGSAIGCLFMAFVACRWPNMLTVCAMLILSGLGLGFTMGTPLNYMMLENTDEAESNSALATMSLVRSIGMAVAPALMVGFLVHSAASIQDDIGAVLPNEVSISALPHADELQAELDDLANDPDYADMMAEMADMPNLSDMQTVSVNMSDMSGGGDYVVPDYLIDEMQNGDVTTIVDTTKKLVAVMFDQVSPDLVREVVDNIGKGEAGMTEGSEKLSDGITEMEDGIAELNNGIVELNNGIYAQTQARAQLANMIPTVEKMTNYESVLDVMPQEAVNALPEMAQSALADVKTSDDLSDKIGQLNGAIAGLDAQIGALQATIDDESASEEDKAAAGAQLEGLNASKASMESMIAQLEGLYPTLNQLENYSSVVDLMPESVKNALPASVLNSLYSVKTVNDLYYQISQIDNASAQMVSARNEMQDAVAEMESGLIDMNEARDKISQMLAWTAELKAAVPAAFDEAKDNYLEAVDECAPSIQGVYQKALNEGFRGMALFVAVCSVIGLLILIPYRDKKRENTQVPTTTQAPVCE